jgi:hypothetical protein
VSQRPSAAADEERRATASGDVHLVRHAVALDRRSWSQPDELRPLDARGREQARGLVARYLVRAPQRIVSSPALRCVETLAPTAQACGLTVVAVPYLEEGSPPEAACDGLIAALTSMTASSERSGSPAGRPGATGSAAAGTDRVGRLLLACTHGDVLEGLIELLLHEGVAFEGPTRTPKSVTYELAVAGGRVARARFVPPPD